MGIFSRRKKDDDSDAWYNKGRSLAQLERLEEAIECYNVAIRLNPENSNAWLNKGNALAKLGQQEEAIECFDVATFCIAIGALALVHVPQPARSSAGAQSSGSVLKESVYGFKYILAAAQANLGAQKYI